MADNKPVAEEDAEVIEDAVPTPPEEDQAPDVEVIDLDSIESFDEKVERHDEVDDGGDKQTATEEPAAEKPAPVKKATKKKDGGWNEGPVRARTTWVRTAK